MGNRRRLVKLAFLVAFLAVQTATPLFDRYPILLWLGTALLVAVLVDSVWCMRCQWRRLREKGTAEESPG